MTDVPVPTTMTNGATAPATPAPVEANGVAPAVAKTSAPIFTRPAPIKKVLVRPAHRPVAPPAPAQAAPVEVSSPGAAVGTTPAPGEPPVPSTDVAAEGAEAATEATADGAPAEPKAETITEAEEARRLARITKQGAKLATERKAFSEEKAAFERERATHGQALERVRMVEQGRQLAHQDPIGFLHRAFGVPAARVLDALLEDGARDPKARAAQEHQSAERARHDELAKLRQEVQTGLQSFEQREAQREIETFKNTAIAPVLADSAKYELTLRTLKDGAVNEVFALIQRRYQITEAEVKAGKRRAPEVLGPAQAADMIESHLRKQRDVLNGTTSTPAKAPQQTKKDEPPKVAAKGSQTATAPSPGAYRNPPKAYTTKPVLR